MATGLHNHAALEGILPFDTKAAILGPGILHPPFERIVDAFPSNSDSGCCIPIICNFSVFVSDSISEVAGSNCEFFLACLFGGKEYRFSHQKRSFQPFILLLDHSYFFVSSVVFV